MSPEELRVIVISDQQGKIQERITVKELKLRKNQASDIEPLDIKLYRTAIDYYTQATQAADIQAEDLLLYLIEKSHYSKYEYIERLANLYRRQGRVDKERCLLHLAKRKMHESAEHELIILRIDKRLEKLAGTLLAINRQQLSFN